MKIRKSVINQILDTYSIRAKEFEQLEGIEGRYRSQYTKGYQITIELERVGDKETGRILVYHTSGKGRRKFTDVWEKEKSGSGYYWLFRNPANIPLSDVEAIRDLEKELEDVKTAARKLQEEYKENSLRNTIANTETKRSVGRPKETEKQKEKAIEIQKLLKAGKSNSEIMDSMNLSKATFFRLKQISVS